MYSSIYTHTLYMYTWWICVYSLDSEVLPWQRKHQLYQQPRQKMAVIALCCKRSRGLTKPRKHNSCGKTQLHPIWATMTVFLGAVNNNYMKEVVWGTMREAALLGTGLKQHAGPGSTHAWRGTHNNSVPEVCIVQEWQARKKPGA